MKNVLINLYQRDYITFYLLVWVLDLFFTFIFKFPIITVTLCFIQIIFALTAIFKRFKK